MTKNTPRIFISLLLMLLCIGILPVSAFASGGDYPDDALPAAAGKGGNGENPDAQEHQQQTDKNAWCVLSHGSTPPFPK